MTAEHSEALMMKVCRPGAQIQDAHQDVQWSVCQILTHEGTRSKDIQFSGVARTPFLNLILRSSGLCT